MKINYTKEDKKNMREALDAVLDDLREIYNISGRVELETSFYLNGRGTDRYNLCMTKGKTCFCREVETGHTILDKPNGLIKRPAIKDYDLMYDFLSQYDSIRSKVESEVKKYAHSREEMTRMLLDLKSRYSHESTIEIELEETNNPRSIEVVEENGSTIGEFHFGRDTVRIITKGNIVVVNKPEQHNKTR